MRIVCSPAPPNRLAPLARKGEQRSQGSRKLGAAHFGTPCLAQPCRITSPVMAAIPTFIREVFELIQDWDAMDPSATFALLVTWNELSPANLKVSFGELILVVGCALPFNFLIVVWPWKARQQSKDHAKLLRHPLFLDIGLTVTLVHGHVQPRRVRQSVGVEGCLTAFRAV